MRQIFLSRIPHLAFLSIFVAVVSANGIIGTSVIPLQILAVILTFMAAYVIYNMCMSFSPSRYGEEIYFEDSPLNNLDSDLCKVIQALETQIIIEKNLAERDRKVNEWWARAFFVIAFLVPFITWGIALTIYETIDSYANLWALVFSGTSVGWISFSAAKAFSIRQGALRKEVNYQSNKLSNLRKIGLMASQEERLGSSQVLDSMRIYFSLQEYFKESAPEDKDNESNLVTIMTNMAKMLNR